MSDLFPKLAVTCKATATEVPPFNHVCGGLQDFTVWWEQEPALGNGRGFPAKKELTKEFSSNFLPFVL